MTWLDKIRLGLVPGKVRTLYTLLLVEQWTINQPGFTDERDGSLYAFGRGQGYRFTMTAMEDRWPVLGRLGRWVEKTRSG